MKALRTLSEFHPSLLVKVIFLILIFISSASHASHKKHTIEFGGSFGYHYSPDYVEAIVGDTIEWKGDFSAYWLQSISVPSGAKSFNADSVSTFQYVVRNQGEYDYRNPVYFSIGMRGIIIVDTIKQGLTNEGREFFLGMPIRTSSYHYSKVFAMVNSYYENDINISYFDASGIEETPFIYHVAAKGFLQIPLDVSKMFMDTSSEKTAYKSCHITSKLPITVECFAVDLYGETYLSLPLISLGKRYVVASYYDNPVGGSVNKPSGPCGGAFLIIGAEESTNIQITPTTTTIGGHPGINMGEGATGLPQPYTISLNKGQCYLVRSNGRQDGNDISGSIVEASRPIIVISGHENAAIGDILYGNDANYLIEQMTPYEYWDSLGYISIPFAEPTPPGDEGFGDFYRIYSLDSSSFNTHLNVGGISGGYDFVTKRYLIPQLFDVIGPVEASSTNGHKINVMQYDQRMYSKPNPHQMPAPCMMNVVPKSRWRKFYSFVVPNFGAAHNYLNVISSHLDDIKISFNNLPPAPISSLTRDFVLGGISSQDNSIFGAQYKLLIPSSSIQSFPTYLYSEYPFIVYYYHIFTANDADYEFAAPAGMQLNTGVTPSFVISIDSSNCTSWHFCVRDTSKDDPGIKSVMLVDDPDGVYFEPGEQLKNVSFDTTIRYMENELRPQGAKEYCFDVNITNPLLNALAPVAIVDNGGNAVLLTLTKYASTLKLSTNPPTSRADSIVFPVKKIGDQICTTFVFKNTAPNGGTPLNLSSALLTNTDTSYKIQSVTPSLPHSLAPQDSLTLQVCYTPQDSLRHRDSLVMRTDCFSFAISLDAHGSTGLISAADLDFGTINSGDTLCKNVQIKNVGTAPFTLTKSFVLSDAINFSVDSSKLPVLIPPGGSVQINTCFHPQNEGPYSAGIDWSTDLEASFAHSIKSHTVLNGNATPKAQVRSLSQTNVFTIHPNPANGNSVIVTFSSGLDFSPTWKSTLAMFDVLGREIYHRDILSGMSQIEIPIRQIPEGVYYVQLTSNSGSASQKFVKMK